MSPPSVARRGGTATGRPSTQASAWPEEAVAKGSMRAQPVPSRNLDVRLEGQRKGRPIALQQRRDRQQTGVRENVLAGLAQQVLHERFGPRRMPNSAGDGNRVHNRRALEGDALFVRVTRARVVGGLCRLALIHSGRKSQMRQASLQGLDQVENADIELTDLEPCYQLLLWEDLCGIIWRAEDALRFSALPGSLLVPLKDEQCSVSLGVQLRIGSAQANARLFQHRLPRSLPALRRLEVLAEPALGAPRDHHLSSRERRPPRDVAAVGFSVQRRIHCRIRADEDIRRLHLALDQIRDRDGPLSFTLEGEASGRFERWAELPLEESGDRKSTRLNSSHQI